MAAKVITLRVPAAKLEKRTYAVLVGGKFSFGKSPQEALRKAVSAQS